MEGTQQHMETPKSSRVYNPITPDVPLRDFQFGPRQPIPRRVFQFFGGQTNGDKSKQTFRRERIVKKKSPMIRHKELFKSKYLKRDDVAKNGVRYNRRFDLLMKFREAGK